MPARALSPHSGRLPLLRPEGPEIAEGAACGRPPRSFASNPAMETYTKYMSDQFVSWVVCQRHPRKFSLMTLT